MGALHSNGVQLKIGDGGGTEAFNAIGRVVSIGGFGGGSASSIDVSDLSMTFKEKLIGQIDAGQISLAIVFDTDEAQQTALRTDFVAQVLRNFELDLTDAGPTTISFSSFVSAFNLNVAVDDKIGLDLTLDVSGGYTYA